MFSSWEISFANTSLPPTEEYGVFNHKSGGLKMSCSKTINIMIDSKKLMM